MSVHERVALPRRETVTDWRLALAGLTLLLCLRYTLAAYGSSPPASAADPLFFEWAGIQFAGGATPYVDVWDIKPPGIVYLATLLAVVAGGDPHRLHLLSILTMTAATAGYVVGGATLAAHWSRSRWGGIATGLALLVFPRTAYLPASGLWAIPVALGFAVALLWAITIDEPLAAGVAGALACLFWPTTLPVVALGGAWLVARRDVHPVAAYVAGGVAVAVVAVLPMVAAGAGRAMLVETVLVPLQAGEVKSILEPIGRSVIELRLAIVVTPLVAVAAAWLARARPRYAGALVGGLGVTVATAVLLDNDGAGDLMAPYLFACLALGVAVGHWPPRWRRRVVAGLAVLVGVNLALVGSAGVVVKAPGPQPLAEGEDPTLVRQSVRAAGTAMIGERAVTPPRERVGAPTRSEVGLSSMAALFWQDRRVDRCHVRLSGTEHRWIQTTPATYRDRTCGVIP